MSTTSLTVSRLSNATSLGFVKVGWWSAAYESTASPIIIGGSPRTGSTLLRVMLNRHPQIWIGPENGVFQEGGQNFAGMEACLGVSTRRLKALRRRSCCLGEFIDLAMGEALNLQGKPIWGIKSPSVVDALSLVFRFFPRAKFIHIIRDGRDVVCSLRTHPKYKTVGGEQVVTGIVNPWEDCVRRWKESTRRALQWRDDNRYCEIRYENLVSNPEQTLRKLLHDLGLEFDKMLLCENQNPVNEGIDTPHPGVAKGVYDSATGRWRTDLPPEGLSAFDADARELLADLKYDSDGDRW